jgi:hypothetical protein
MWPARCASFFSTRPRREQRNNLAAGGFWVLEAADLDEALSLGRNLTMFSIGVQRWSDGTEDR